MSNKTEQVKLSDKQVKTKTVEYKANLNEYKWKVGDILIMTEDINNIVKGTFIIIMKRNRGYTFHTISQSNRETIYNYFGCESFRKPSKNDWEVVFNNYDPTEINKTTDILAEIPF